MAEVERQSPVRLERSVLFVPGSNWRMIEKAAASAADAVCIDLEDAVAPEAKETSRSNVIRALKQLPFGPRLRMFRMNALDTRFAYRDLVEVVEAVGDRLELVMVPKVSGPESVAFVATLLMQIEMQCGFERSIGIEAQIETASGLLQVREIARASPRLEALIFGPADFAASMQMPSGGIGEYDAYDESYPGHRWHAVMQAIVAAGRANGLRCIDGPYGRYKDMIGFKRSCTIAYSMGFDGKQCIHPDQLIPTNAMFTPSGDEAERAELVIEAYERNVAERRGAFGSEGKLIDAANLRMARTVAQRARLSRARQNQNSDR